jgi:HK97 gp10 family phage protein
VVINEQVVSALSQLTKFRINKTLYRSVLRRNGECLIDLQGTLNSLGITPIRRDSEGDWSAKIGFDGYDKKGVANQLKARVMESGSSKQKKKPFIRPAVNQVKQKATDEMERIIIEETQNIMGIMGGK